MDSAPRSFDCSRPDDPLARPHAPEPHTAAHSRPQTTMSSSIPPLPAHIQTVLITGSGGYVGREVGSLLLARYPSIKLILTDVREPAPIGASECVAADLSDEKDVEQLLKGRAIDAVGPGTACRVRAD